MTMVPLRLAATVLLATVMVAAAHAPATARIVCDGGFQIVRGQPIATLYCAEENLAQVAQSYGMHVSVEALRRSESTKASVCRSIGHDNRVRSVCLPYRSTRTPF
jgi:hypothetical protein